MNKKTFNLLFIILMVLFLTSCSVTGPNQNKPGGNPEPDKPGVEVDNSKTPTIYLAGDSTVKTYEKGQFIGGWGQYLDLFLDDSITVINAAQGGRSSRSFINEGRLYNITDENYKYSFTQNEGKSIEDCIKEGDFLFIQFGHNDDSSKAASSYATMFDRMVPLGEPNEKGIYPVTPAERTSTSALPTEFTDLATDSEETAALNEIAKYGSTYYAYGSGTYKWYLKQYIDFAREKGAIPVLVTPVARVKFSNGEIIGGAGLHGENFAYVEAVRQLAEEEDCLLIDLFSESKMMLETATPTYANYLMALKPNDLIGTWPASYDTTYGNTAAGYTGIEATHYNKYGAYLQAAKVVENILLSTKETENKERFNFADHILKTPLEFIDPSNLISKQIVANIEGLFKEVNVTNRNRTYANPQEVINLINQLEAFGDVTNDNYLELQVECENIRLAYTSLNIDDRSAVINLATLESYEAAIKALIDSNRKEPVRVIIFNADDLTLDTYSETVVEGDFTLVATADKTMTKKSAKSSFVYAGNEYSTTYGLSVGGKASFGNNRYISFEVDGACTVTVVAKSSSSSEDRTLSLVDANKTNVATFDAKASLSITSAEITTAGTYSLGSAGSGMYIYMIIIEYFE